MSGLLEVSRSGSVVEVALNRPEARNALSIELCDAIVEALRHIDGDPEARVLVVKGKGPVFCSGADFALVARPEGGRFLSVFESMLEALGSFRLPTIAAIQGAALGGGFQLATVCAFASRHRRRGSGSPRRAWASWSISKTSNVSSPSPALRWRRKC